MIKSNFHTHTTFCDGKNTPREMVERALELGFDHAAALDVKRLCALPEVRDMCASGRCRRYGKSWSCPPACGTIEVCAERMGRYTGGVLVQTTAQLEDDFDIEGMNRAQEQHKKRFFHISSLSGYTACSIAGR
jgi:predicted metal-binding protein